MKQTQEHLLVKRNSVGCRFTKGYVLTVVFTLSCYKLSKIDKFVEVTSSPIFDFLSTTDSYIKVRVNDNKSIFIFRYAN